jgi:hypothetical protein
VSVLWVSYQPLVWTRLSPSEVWKQVKRGVTLIRALDRSMDSCAHSLGEQKIQDGEGEFPDPRPKWYKCERSG